MKEIDGSKFQVILLLYDGWKHHMSLRAAAEGKAIAQVWADSIDSPVAAAVCFGIRVLISGNPQDTACRNEIADFLKNIVQKNKIERMNHFFMLFWNEPGWQDVLLEILSGCKSYLREREYYGRDMLYNLNELPQFKDCELLLPKGYELRFVDEGFLNEREWGNKGTLQYEMCSERVSIYDFLKYSFGVCAVQGNEIAGWCLSEYNNSKGCEVGIEVMEGHQRKGIGTALTLALAEEAGKQGLQHVGWSCFKDNLPSSATACKAGFVKLDDYKVIVVQR